MIGKSIMKAQYWPYLCSASFGIYSPVVQYIN